MSDLFKYMSVKGIMFFGLNMELGMKMMIMKMMIVKTMVKKICQMMMMDMMNFSNVAVDDIEAERFGEDLTVNVDQETTFILGLREKFKVCDQICSYVADEVRDLLGLAREHLRGQVRQTVGDHVEAADLDSIFEQTEFERSFQYFNSTRHLNSFVKQHMSFVEPEEYVFGRMANGKSKSMQYVSVLQTLHALLERDDVFAEVVQGHQQDGFLSDYCDGSH